MWKFLGDNPHNMKSLLSYERNAKEDIFRRRKGLGICFAKLGM